MGTWERKKDSVGQKICNPKTTHLDAVSNEDINLEDIYSSLKNLKIAVKKHEFKIYTKFALFSLIYKHMVDLYNTKCGYLASSVVTVTWFTVHDSSCLLEDESVSAGFLPRQNPGVLGCCIVAVSLLSIKTTEDMLGLSSACSCTHSRPTCIHLNASEAEYESPTDESTSSNPFPS